MHKINRLTVVRRLILFDREISYTQSEE